MPTISEVCASCGQPKPKVNALKKELAVAKMQNAQVVFMANKMAGERDVAFSERNCLLAALSRVYPSDIGIDGDLEKTNPKWRHLLFIEFPGGTCVWNYHETDAHLFAHLPLRTKPYDGPKTIAAKYKVVLDANKSGIVLL